MNSKGTARPSSDENADRSRLRNRIARLLAASDRIAKEDPDGALERACEALGAAEELGDPRVTAGCLHWLGELGYNRADYAGARNWLRRALSLLEKIDDHEALADVSMRLGHISVRLSEHRHAITHFKRVLEVYHPAGNADAVSTALRELGSLYNRLGDYPRALEFLLRNHDAVSKEDDPDATGASLADIGVVYGTMGDYERAIEFFRGALVHFTASGNKALEAQAVANIALMESSQNSLEAALKHAMTAMVIHETLGDQRGLATALVNIGSIHEKMGRLDVALHYHLRAHAILDDLKDDRSDAPVLLNIGNLYRKVGRLDDAVLILERALLVSQESGDRQTEQQVHLFLMETQESRGDAVRALYHSRLSSAIQLELQGLERQRIIAELQIRFDVERTEREKEIYRLSAERLEQDMANKVSELNAKTVNLVERNAFIDEIRVALVALEKLPEDRTRPVIRELINRLKHSADPEQDWKEFETRFEQVHQNFLQRIKQLYPKLTRSELKVCALIRSGRSTKEIAVILHVSERTITTHRTSINARIGRPPGSSLASFLDGL
jgi:tetratricopeptide (TPR) repeat protein